MEKWVAERLMPTPGLLAATDASFFFGLFFECFRWLLFRTRVSDGNDTENDHAVDKHLRGNINIRKILKIWCKLATWCESPEIKRHDSNGELTIPCIHGSIGNRSGAGSRFGIFFPRRPRFAGYRRCPPVENRLGSVKAFRISFVSEFA